MSYLNFFVLIYANWMIGPVLKRRQNDNLKLGILCFPLGPHSEKTEFSDVCTFCTFLLRRNYFPYKLNENSHLYSKQSHLLAFMKCFC